jgi:ribosomal protein S18 acetylase RimI-like enzyme
MIDIATARIPEDLPVIRQLFLEYAESLGFELCFQDFDTELAQLPGKYAAPEGRLLLAWVDGKPAGCVALRRIDQQRCEMKRLYVRPEMRSLKLGRLLAQRICDDARQAGYRSICLDTLPTMTAAVSLYTAMGFKPVEAYVFNPFEEAIYLGLAL